MVGPGSDSDNRYRTLSPSAVPCPVREFADQDQDQDHGEGGGANSCAPRPRFSPASLALSVGCCAIRGNWVDGGRLEGGITLRTNQLRPLSGLVTARNGSCA